MVIPTHPSGVHNSDDAAKSHIPPHGGGKCDFAHRSRWAYRAAQGVLISALLAMQTIAHAPGAHAQSDDGQGVVVHRVFVKEGQRDTTGSEALELKVVYSILNRDDQSALEAGKILGSKLTFDKQTDIPPISDEPIESAAWNIVLLTDLTDAGNQDDGSGLNAARQALAREMEQGPDGLYAWYDINESLRPRQEDFKPVKDQKANPAAGATGQDKDTSIPALLSTPVRAPGQTLCLNRAVLAAVKKVQTAPGRKAVLVLTHQPDNCPTPTPFQEVVDAATNTRNEGQLVQIFAIGLGNEALRQDLERLTLKTGGAAFVTPNQDTLQPTIRQLMSLMKGQREASYVVYPKRGEHESRLDVSLNESTIKSARFAFSNELNYAPPPSIQVINTPSSPEGIRVILRAVSPERLKNLRLQLIDQSTAKPIRLQTAPDAASFFDADGAAQWLIPRKEGESELQPGVSYQLSLRYELPNGNVVSAFSEDGIKTVEYDPVPPRIGITARGPTVRSPKFVITVTSNADATALDVFLARPEEATKPVGDVRKLTVNSGTAKSIEISSEGLPEGAYVARAEWSGVSETGATSPPMTVAIETPFQRLVREAGESQAVRGGLIGLIALALLAIIGMFVLLRVRSVSQVKVVKGEGIEGGRVRRIQINNSGYAQKGAKPPLEGRPIEPQPREAAPVLRAEPAPVRADPERPASVPVARIQIKTPAAVKFKGKIKKSPFSIGRDSANDGMLPVEGSSGVSRKHATFMFINGQWHLRDDNSPNGTQINGMRLPPNQPIPIPDGATLTLGTVTLEFRLEP